MSWSSWSESITKIAREAQRGIDKVLDITEEEAQAQQQGSQLLETSEQTNEIEEPKILQNEPPETPKPKKKETNGWNYLYAEDVQADVTIRTTLNLEDPATEISEN